MRRMARTEAGCFPGVARHLRPLPRAWGHDTPRAGSAGRIDHRQGTDVPALDHPARGISRSAATAMPNSLGRRARAVRGTGARDSRYACVFGSHLWRRLPSPGKTDTIPPKASTVRMGVRHRLRAARAGCRGPALSQSLSGYAARPRGVSPRRYAMRLREALRSRNLGCSVGREDNLYRCDFRDLHRIIVAVQLALGSSRQDQQDRSPQATPSYRHRRGPCASRSLRSRTTVV